MKDNYQSWELKNALSRISSLLGSYIPAHNFDLSVDKPNSKLKIDLNTCWTQIHPEGSIQSYDKAQSHELLQSQYVGLWLSDEDNSQALVVRGFENKNHVVLEESNNQQFTINIQEALASGDLIRFTLKPISDVIANDGDPQLATEWFIHTISKRKNIIRDAILATLIMNFLAVGISLYSMQVYDRVVPSQSNSTLIVLTIGILIAITFDFSLKKLRSKITEQAFKDIDLELGSVFFNKALMIRLDARPKNVGTFISEIRQYEFVRNFMTSATLFALADGPFSLFFLVFIFLIAGPLALIPFGFLIVMAIGGHLLSLKLNQSNQRLFEESNRKNGFLIEAIDGIESIKAVSGESQILRSWQEMSLNQSVRELHVKETTTTTSTLSYSLQQLAYISVVAVGAMMIHNNLLTQGALVGCTILTSRVLSPMMQLPQLLVQWTQVKASLAGLNRIMSLPSDEDNFKDAIVPSEFKSEIKIENVSFEYDQKRPIVKIPKLHFGPGEIVVIMGRVGSGKSTLIKMISGLYKPTDGKITIDGVDMAHLATGYVRQHIGYLPQDVRLIKGTLKENLTLGLPFSSDSEILAAASKVGLDRLIKSHPAGMALPISEGGMGLSGGQRQMVALARLFLANPQIMVLDEPTASLDGELENHVLRELIENQKNKKQTLIVVSHKPSIIKYASRLILLEAGRIVQDGPRDEIIAKLRGQQTSTRVENV